MEKLLAFNGLAWNYHKARPNYPDAMLQFIQEKIKSSQVVSRIAVDVGCGTGISTQAIRAALLPGWSIVGVEPNDDMLCQAQNENNDSSISFLKGQAENLEPFAAKSLGFIGAGQAVQWFDRPAFFSEVQRVVEDGGLLAIFENNRDWRASEFLSAHEDFLENYADREDGTRYSRFYRDHPYAMELLRNFGNVTARQFHWKRVMEIDEFVTMALSSTQVQRALVSTGEKEGVRTIRTYCCQYSDDNGKLVVPYLTELYLAEVG